MAPPRGSTAYLPLGAGTSPKFRTTPPMERAAPARSIPYVLHRFCTVLTTFSERSYFVTFPNVFATFSHPGLIIRPGGRAQRAPLGVAPSPLPVRPPRS